MIKIMNLDGAPFVVAAVRRNASGQFEVYDRQGIAHNMGNPVSHPGAGRNRSRKTWAAFSMSDRRAVVKAARRIGADLRVFLGPKS